MKSRLPHILAVSIATALLIATPKPAQSSAVWGATEWTQIANNLELVMQYKEMVEQTITQVRQYEAQLKALRQLDKGRLEEMLRGVNGVRVGEEILDAVAESGMVHERLRSLAGNMQVLIKEGRNAMEVAKVLRERGFSVNPDDYISMMRQLAELEQDTYAERLESLDRAAEDAQHDIERVQRIAELSGDIETHVEGFGALLQSSAVISSQLAGLRQTMSAAATMNTETARMLAEQAAERKVEGQRFEDWADSNFTPVGREQ